VIPEHTDIHYPPPHPEAANTGTPDVDAQRSLEGRMAYTGSSFEALLRKAPQDEVVGFMLLFDLRVPMKSAWVSPSRLGSIVCFGDDALN